MADTIDLQSEQFMTLLTDALRAGPGSPEWSQAVKVLRASDQNTDEYTLLYAAREHLESGKDYRSVRAGPGFTRKLMEGVEAEGQPAAPSSAGLIALIAGLVIVAVIVVVSVMIYKGNPTAPDKHADDLATMIFGNRLVAARFVAGKDQAPVVEPGWTAFGELPLSTNGDLRPTTRPTPGNVDAYKAGGWVTSVAIPADQPIEVDATVKVTRPGDDGIVQVFVSDEPITDANAAGGHALVWQLKGTESRAFLPDGKNAGPSEKLAGARDVVVRVRVGKDLALVDAGEQRLYAGANLLVADKPRYVGVRFLRHGGETWDRLGVVGLVVQKP